MQISPWALRLKESAGWNQVESDWTRLLDLQPDGCFVAELNGIPAGVVTTCRFGIVAWIAMMLVDELFRSRGIGRALMMCALDDRHKRCEDPSPRCDVTRPSPLRIARFRGRVDNRR